MFKKLLAIAVLAVSIVAGMSAALAATPNYVFAVGTNGTFTDMSSGTTQLSAPGDDDFASGLVSIGFDFFLNGARQSQFGASSNGLIRFGTAPGASSYAIGANNQALMACLVADNVVSSTGKVHYKVTGAAPNRVLTVEFLNLSVIYNATTIEPNPSTCQVRVYETSGKIELVYGKMYRNASLGFSGNNEPTEFGFSTANTATTIASINTADTLAFTVQANQFPKDAPMASLNSPTDGSRKIYTFTPPVPTAPTNLTFTNIGPTTTTLNWTDSPDELIYAIYGSTDGVNYFFAGTAAANAVLFNATGLTPGQSYTWRVYAVSEGALSSSPLQGAQATGAGGAVASTAAGGLWSQTATWAGGTVPTATDNVTIANGASVTMDTTAAVALSLTVGSGAGSPATLTWDVTPARTLTVGTFVTIASNGIVQGPATGTIVAHSLVIGTNLTNNGVLDLSTNADTAGVNLTFNGSPVPAPAANVFGGTGATTDVRGITINKGSLQANTVTLSPTNFTVRGLASGFPAAAAGFLTVTNGTFQIGGTFTYSGPVWTAAAYTIPATGAYWQNNPNFTATGQTGNGTLAGLFRLSQGTYNHGTATGNGLVWSTGSIVTIEGGAFNATGRFGVSNQTSVGATYTQTGGAITLCTIGCANSTSLATFDTGANAGGSATITGGTITLQNNSSAASGPRDYRNQAGGQAGSGGTLFLGNAASGAAKTFRISGPMNDVVVTNTSADHSATMYQDDTNGFWFSSIGNLTIQGTTALFTLHGNGTAPLQTDLLIMHGDVVNNGSIVAGTGGTDSELSFSGGPVQNYSGTGSTGYIPIVDVDMDNATDNLVINPAVTSNILTDNLNVFGGGIVNANKITVGNGGTTAPFLQLGNADVAPTPTGTVSGNIVNNAGSGGLTIYYGSTPGSRTSGGELTDTRSAATIQLDDTGDATHTLTIAGGNLTATASLVLGNQRLITGANTMIIAPGGSLSRVSGYVDGSLRKTFTAAAAANFEVGSSNGYSPVLFNVTAGTFPADVTTAAFGITEPLAFPAAKAITRYWTLTASGITADLTFNYLAIDVPGTLAPEESLMQLYRRQPPSTTFDNLGNGGLNPVAKTFTLLGNSVFSNWTLGNNITPVQLLNYTVE